MTDAGLDQQLYSVKDLRSYGLSHGTVYGFMQDGRLPYVQFCEGGKRFIRRADFLALVESNVKTAEKVSDQK